MRNSAVDKREDGYKEAASAETTGGFLGGMRTAFMDSAMPSQAFGVKLRNVRPAREYILFANDKYRYSTLAKFGGITRSASSSAIEQEARRIGLSEYDVKSKTGSKALDRMIDRQVAVLVEPALAAFMKTDLYKRKNFAQRRNAVKKKITEFRSAIRGNAEGSAVAAYQYEQRELQEALEKAEKAGNENEALDLTIEIIKRDYVSLTGPTARRDWMQLNKDQKTEGERLVAEKHREVMKNIKAGRQPSRIDILFMQRDTVADTGLFG